jgi:hypothetical protein
MNKFGILTALKHRNFRVYWLGFVTAVSGMQMFLVVQAWLVFDQPFNWDCSLSPEHSPQ